MAARYKLGSNVARTTQLVPVAAIRPTTKRPTDHHHMILVYRHTAIHRHIRYSAQQRSVLGQIVQQRILVVGSFEADGSRRAAVVDRVEPWAGALPSYSVEFVNGMAAEIAVVAVVVVVVA